jgi:hypothetical protein
MARAVLSGVLLSLGLGSVLAGEDSSLPPYKWPGPPKYSLWTDHLPLPGWRIERVPKGTAEVFLRQSGRDRKARGVLTRDNPCLKGVNEDLFLLHFEYPEYLKAGGPPIPGMDAKPRPIFLGWDFYDFAKRYRRWTGERGLSRQYVIADQFGGIDAEPLNVPPFRIERASPQADLQRFLMPVVTAEGAGDYLVIDAFDRAGMTVGFTQMAAHTPDDLIDLMKRLLQDETLRGDPYADPKRWFPELAVTTEGRLSYRTSREPDPVLASLEECTRHRSPNEGFHRPPSWAYFREDFVRFCNPDVRVIDPEELQFAARWIMWSLSPKMRAAQITPSVDNVVQSLRRIDPVPTKVRADAAAMAAVILYWNDGVDYRKRVGKLLAQPDPVAAFFSLESREGDPKAAMCEGDLICKSPAWFKVPEGDRQVLNRRVESVRLLCEADPTLLPRLRQLTYNIADGTLTVTAPPVVPPTPAVP